MQISEIIKRQLRAVVRPVSPGTLSLCLMILLIASCATTPHLPPPPPKYVPHEDKAMSSVNSLWQDTASLYEDIKARRVNDLVTIRVVENITGSGKADTNTDRKSSLDAGVDNFFGAPLNLNTNNLYGRGYTFEPKVKGSAESIFEGSGETTREGKLIGMITAKVVEVMPNGILVLESRKEITINREKQILILRGMVRPDDIAKDNTVLSSRISDAEVFFVGDGVIQDKQGPNWLVRFIDKVWPF
jgi:flagellar L-ring protein FlgH